jgi:hypothetical protein
MAKVFLGAARLACAVAIGAVCVQVGASAAADIQAPPPDAAADGFDPRARAQALLDQGNERFDADDFAAALRLYESAYNVFASPKLLFNMARCEVGLGLRPQAIRHFVRFLSDATDVEPDVLKEAERQVQALGAALVRIDVTGAPAGAAVKIDGVVTALVPLDGPLWAEPGRHAISVDRPGRPPYLSSVKGKAGTTLALNIPDVPVARAPLSEPPPVVEQPRRPLTKRWWFWTSLGAVVLGGAAATYLIVRENNRCPATKCD